ncbi:scavenger receptor cysteine-rich type 1 protein M160-like [Lytechinus variegatus]|uniref:scavenger receptor cysteine-rich type 1 protein M160-like n=1 Tax=Lytechinus variegatus TaxID=7654 RepID=UPI001BB1DC9F|nr:scavenger receptor cysteine-rich type 1 protein M160-like [Lytechinus variegatus]
MYGMTTSEGAVFMFKDDRWWPICAEDWTINEAEVACRQMGYPEPYAESSLLPDYIELNVSRGLNWIDGIICGGYESQLKWCRGGGWGYCTSGRAAGVTCHTESDLFESDYIWPTAMLIFACFMGYVCKKVRDQHRMRSATQTNTTSIEESSDHGDDVDDDPSHQSESQADHEVLHYYSTSIGGNLKNAPYITPLPRHVPQGPMTDAQEENVLILTGLPGNLPNSHDWDIPGAPTAPPPDHAPSYAYRQTLDSSPLQGTSYYPSQHDPALQDAPPPPPSYEEAMRQDQ